MTDHELDRIAEDKAREHYQSPYAIAFWAQGYCDAFNGKERHRFHYSEQAIYNEGYDAGKAELMADH